MQGMRHRRRSLLWSISCCGPVSRIISAILTRTGSRISSRTAFRIAGRVEAVLRIFRVIGVLRVVRAERIEIPIFCTSFCISTTNSAKFKRKAGQRSMKRSWKGKDNDLNQSFHDCVPKKSMQRRDTCCPKKYAKDKRLQVFFSLIRAQ